MSLLEVDNVSKKFGGLVALDQVSIDLEEGELVSLVGPNGAGKSTLINVLTGMLHPTDGTVRYAGTDIVGLEPYEIVQLGIGRSFQMAEIFPELTVRENITVAAFISKQGSFSVNFFRRRSTYDEVHARTAEIIETIGFEEEADTQAKHLAYGDTRRLEVAIGMATDPDLMFMDEPTAGMSPGETEMTTALIRTMLEDWGITILLVEHDMDVVFNVSDRIITLHQGSIIARGTPDEIRDDPTVRKAYLGGAGG